MDREAIHLGDGLVAVHMQSLLQAESFASQRWNGVFDARPHHPAHIVEFHVARGCTPSEDDKKQSRLIGHDDRAKPPTKPQTTTTRQAGCFQPTRSRKATNAKLKSALFFMPASQTG